MHNLDTAGLELPGDTISRADMEGRAQLLLERIGALAETGLVPDAAPLRVLADVSPRRPAKAQLAPCHGDLYARHVLVDENGRPSAIIDWGDVHAGHPANDLSIARGFLPVTAQRAFLGAYGAVDEQSWAFARLRALMLYGHEIGDSTLLREGTRSLAYVVPRSGSMIGLCSPQQLLRATGQLGDQPPLVVRVRHSKFLAPPRARRAFSHLKTWLRGTHRVVSGEHTFHPCLNEFLFR